MAKASRERPAPRAMAGTGQEPASITVRRARPSDLSHVVRLRLALLHEHGEHPVYSRLRKDAEKRAHEMFASQLVSPGEVIFLAERDAEVVGILRCVESLASPLLEPPRYGYVSSVYVTPEARRHGVLRALVASAEAWCRDRGLTEIRLHSVVGDPVSGTAWDRTGFDPVEVVRLKRLT